MTIRRPTVVLVAALLAAAGGPALPVRADDDPAAVQRQLRDVEGALAGDREKAAALAAAVAAQARDLAALRAEMQAAARAVQSHEAAIADLARERAVLGVDIAGKRTALAARRAQLGSTLAALQRIALRPPAALLVLPGDPNDMVRSGLLMRTAVPQIETRAAALRRDLEALAALDAQLAANRRDLAAAAAALGAEQGRLVTLIDRKNALFAATQAERDAATAHVERLTRQARTLGDLLEALAQRGAMHDAAPRPRPAVPATAGETGPATAAAASPPRVAAAVRPAAPAVSGARGQLTPPARGEVIVGFGDSNAFGATARGVTWRVRPAATVLAPWDGQVAFAGPFRHFGRILIIDHGEGYHSLIAGLARIDAHAGQWVLAGEPIGAAGDAAPGAAGTGNDKPARAGAGSDTGGGGPSAGPGDRAEGPTVYVEFRRNGQPINPLPWLAASLDRTNGQW